MFGQEQALKHQAEEMDALVAKSRSELAVAGPRYELEQS